MPRADSGGAAPDRGRRALPRSHAPPRPRRRRVRRPTRTAARRPGTWSAEALAPAWGRRCRRRAAGPGQPTAFGAYPRAMSSGQRHPAEALRRSIAGALTELLAAPADPSSDVLERPELAGMTAQCRDLGVQGRTDVDELVRLVRAPQEQLGDLPRREPGLDVLAEVERVARRREDRIDGRLSHRPMIGMVHPLVVDEQHGRVMGHDDLGLELANDTRDPLAQLERRLHLAVGLVEELDAVDADLGGRGALLPLPQLCERHRIGARIVAALVAAR